MKLVLKTSQPTELLLNTVEPEALILKTENDITVEKVVMDAPNYEGEYEITPKIEAQTIETAQKLMKEDMQIKAIPFYNVSNTAGGNTIYIGNEV